MILSFWKYLQGYVVVKIRGFAPERFINLCANKNIYIWNVKRVQDGYMFSMSAKAFFLLAPIAKKTRCRVKIVKKSGVPFKFHLFRKRRFFLVGLAISVLMVLALSFFVWRIDVVGNSKYTTEEIVKYLEEQNVSVGIFKPKINCSEIDDILLSHFENTMWVSSELKGTQLIINLREGLSNKYEESDDKPCDIISEMDGTIISIVMRKGTPLVKQGDVVKKGDTLVSGTLEIKELEQLKAVNFTHSDADIYIKTTEQYEDKLDSNYIEKVYLEGKKRVHHSFQVFNYKINLFKPSIKGTKYDKIIKYNQAQLIKNFYLPLYFTDTTYMPYYEVEKLYTADEAKTILDSNYNQYLMKLKENNIQILSDDVEFNEENGEFILAGEIFVAEKTGEIVYFDESTRRQDYNEYFTEENGDTP